jgi:hypothetical protein
MASNIQPYNIDGTFPVAGQDNSSQGFRDNFTNTRNNFLFAQSEITDLQQKVLVTAALNGQSILNDMAGTKITRPQLSAWTQSLYNFGAVSGGATLDFNQGNFQQIYTSGDISLNFANWPTSTGTGALGYGLMRVWIIVTSNSITGKPYTVALPNTVSVGVTEIAGYNPATQTITFDVAGNYIFDFSSIDGGNTYLIFDVTRNHATFRDPSFYLNNIDTQNPTLFVGYGGGLATAQQFELGQDVISVAGSVNSVGIGNLTLANVAYAQIDTGGVAGYSVTSARGSLTSGLPLPVVSGDIVGYVNALTLTGNGAGNVFQQVSSIDFFATGSNVRYGLGGNIAFFTAPDGDASTTRINQAIGIENDQSTNFYGNISISGQVNGNLTTNAGIVDVGYQYLGSPSTNFWANITPSKSRLIIDPTVALSYGNVTLPNCIVDGTIVSISSTAQIAVFGANTLQSGTVVRPNTAINLTAGTAVDYFYHAVENTWYKIR